MTRDDVPSVGARVVAIDSIQGTVLAYTSVGASGHFILRGLPIGDMRLLTVDPVTNRPGSATATIVLSQLTPAAIVVTPAAEMGTIQGSVFNSLGEPAPGVRVRATSYAFAPLWRAEATTGPAGEYSLVAPPGTVQLRANDDPSTENGVTLDPGGTAFLDLTVP